MRHQFPAPLFRADETFVFQNCIHCGVEKKFYATGQSVYVDGNGNTIAATDCKERKSVIVPPKKPRPLKVIVDAIKKDAAEKFPSIVTSIPSNKMSHYDARMLEAYSALKLCYDALVRNNIICRERDIAERTLNSDSYKEVVAHIDSKTTKAIV